MFNKSRQLFQEAQKYMPGGVNSPVRAFKAMGMDPIFIERGEGSKVYDVDGNEYIDYVGSWGPLILGHAHPRIQEVITETAKKGTSFGAPTELETEMAKLVIEAVPSVEVVRMVSSGTEAVMSAVRVARGFTGRDKIIKFVGCFHGHGDSFLIKAGSGVSTLGLPNSPGVTKGVAQDTITVPFNDLKAVEKVFAEIGQEIAAVVLEPVAGNMGLAIPKPGFLEGLREITKEQGSLLIFDEVMTGFRLAYGGAQERLGVVPDMTTLGKVIGGGMPVAAYGAREEIMRQIAPDGAIYQAGTLSGNPISMAVGIETLKMIKEPGTYEKLEKKVDFVVKGIKKAAEKHNIATCMKSMGSMFCTYFNSDDVYDYDTAAACNMAHFSLFFRTLLKEGVYISPAQFESCFMSLVHSQEDLEKTIAAADVAFATIAETL